MLGEFSGGVMDGGVFTNIRYPPFAEVPLRVLDDGSYLMQGITAVCATQQLRPSACGCPMITVN
jgi:hypothetical protein